MLREGYDVGLLNDGFRDLIDELSLDYLLIDTHPGLNEETLLSIAISDVLVVLLRPDRQDFQGTAVTVEVARKLDVRSLVMVLNKVLPSVARARLPGRGRAHLRRAGRSACCSKRRRCWSSAAAACSAFAFPTTR